MGDGKKIKIVIDPMGNPKIEAEGFQGVGCADATKAIEQALSGGDGGVERVMKPEWYEAEDAGVEAENSVEW